MFYEVLFIFCLAALSGVLFIWVIIPRRTLMWVNRIRVARGDEKLDRLESGYREAPYSCPLSASLPNMPSVWHGSIQWPYTLQAESYTKAWKGKNCLPEGSHWLRFRQHPSTMLFAIFFDWGLYPRLIRDS